MLPSKLFSCIFVLLMIISNSFLSACTYLPKKESFKLPTTIADQSMAVQAQLEIAKNKHLWDSSHITVISYKNNLLLVGETPNPTLREQAERIVSNFENIGNIYNQIEIGKPITFADQAKDTWITTQVKTKLVTNRSIDSHMLKVITEAGTVYLFGDLPIHQQKLAAEIAGEINEVKNVIQIFINR